MTNKVKFHVHKNSVTASCGNSRTRCWLYKTFTPAANLRVIADTAKNGRFDCTVFMRHQKEYDIEEAKKTILDIMKQVCAHCQHRTCKQR